MGGGKFTYSGNPAYSAKDQVRFLLGDTDGHEPILTDEEIEWVLSQYNNAPLNAAIRCCESVVAHFSRLMNESVGRVSIEYGTRVKNYQTMMQILRNRLSREGTTPFAGGISRSQKRLQDRDRDRVRPDFTKHMMENEQLAPWTTDTEHALFLINEE